MIKKLAVESGNDEIIEKIIDDIKRN